MNIDPLEVGVAAQLPLDMVIPTQLYLPNITINRPPEQFDCFVRLGTLAAAHEFYPTLHEYWIQRLSSAERSA